MRVLTTLIATMLTSVCCLPASATVRIASDPGGQLGPYLKKLESLRQSGQNVVIDGDCLSACTMVLGVIPRDRICVTARARLGFHAAWRPGQAGADLAGTDLLMSVYPQLVQDWIKRRGGLSRQLIYLNGGELASMYPRCNGGDVAATVEWHSGREHGPGGVSVEHAQGASGAHAATIWSRAH